MYAAVAGAGAGRESGRSGWAGWMRVRACGRVGEHGRARSSRRRPALGHPSLRGFVNSAHESLQAGSPSHTHTRTHARTRARAHTHTLTHSQTPAVDSRRNVETRRCSLQLTAPAGGRLRIACDICARIAVSTITRARAHFQSPLNRSMCVRMAPEDLSQYSLCHDSPHWDSFI